MIRYFVIFIFAALLMVSCEKDALPESTEGAIAFNSEISFDGTAYELAAGKNGLVMQPSLTENDSAIVFTSLLSDPNCPDCGPALELITHSPLGVLPAQVDDWINEFNGWDYLLSSFAEEENSSLVLTLNPGNDFTVGIWFVNGEALNQTPQNSIEVELESAGTYDFGFTSNNPACGTGPNRSINFDGENIPCYANIETSVINPFLVNATPGGGLSLDSTFYTWTYDGQTFGPDLVSTILVDSLLMPPVNICLEATDGMGCSDNFCYVLADFGNCITNISISSSELILNPPDPFEGALVQLAFTDENGLRYQSDPTFPDQGTVQLIAVEAYQEPTKPNEAFARLTFQINTILYDSSNQEHSFSGRVEMALPLP